MGKNNLHILQKEDLANTASAISGISPVKGRFDSAPINLPSLAVHCHSERHVTTWKAALLMFPTVYLDAPGLRSAWIHG